MNSYRSSLFLNWMILHSGKIGRHDLFDRITRKIYDSNHLYSMMEWWDNKGLTKKKQRSFNTN